MSREAAEAVLFVLWFRPATGGRWRRVGRFGTYAEAMNAIGSGGDWRIEEQRAEAPTGPSLFDLEGE